MEPLALRWIASRSASSLHALHQLALGRPFADHRLHDAMREPAEQLAAAVVASSGGTRLWRHLLDWSGHVENNEELAELACRKARVPDASRSRLAAALAAGEASLGQLYPDLLDQLELRARPMREQWEARGPGLLHAIRQRTEPGFLVAEADVFLVQPALGGGGGAHCLNNSLRLEAVLYHPHPELPEAVRLGWMLTQLNVDLPRYGEGIHPESLAALAAIAALPVTLEAAHHVDLVAPQTDSLEAAVRHWHLFHSTPEPDTLHRFTELVRSWWDTVRQCQDEGKFDWNLGLKALVQMLEQDQPSDPWLDRIAY